ncbi:hypothetical protein ACFQX7_14470 [Luedemannella flava]
MSWRLLATEVTGHSATGLTGANFRVYRDGAAIATVTDSTNYLDVSGTVDATYRVAPIVGGRERGRSAPPRRGPATPTTCR